MKLKTPLIIALALTLSLQVAAFSDIPDENMRLAAETLKTFEIVAGYEDGNFHPDDLLTRAAFAKIAVTAKRAEASLPLNKSLTVFSDVLSEHWASAYINVAVRELKIINGFPDGTFRPEEPITNAQAITICLSMLGFETKDIGLFWPRDQINRAVQIKLIDNEHIDPNKAMTRGEAAILLNNLLACEEKESKKNFITNFGSTIDNVLVVASSKTDLSMQEGFLKYVAAKEKEPVLVKSEADIPASYVGKMVTLLTNREGQIVGLIPSDAQITNLVVKAATKDGITDMNGTYHSIALTTPMVINAKVETYEKYMALKPGSSVNLIRDKNGNLIYVQSATSSLVDTKHYVLPYSYETGKNPLLDFYSTDIVKNATFIKDGTPVSIEAFKKGDVITLSADKKIITASSVALSGVLTDAKPTYIKAQSIELYGQQFPLAASYTPDLSSLENKQVTIYLSVDGSVAKVAPVKEGEANMLGVMTAASGNEVTIELANGYTIKNKSVTGSEVLKEYINTLVKLRLSGLGDLVVEPVPMSSSNYGIFDIAKMTYRNYNVSPLVKIFERAGEYSGIHQIDLGDINSFEKKIEGSAVAYYEVNSIGQITLMVLTNVTGNMYDYGKIEMEGESYKISYYDTETKAVGSKSYPMALQISVRGSYGGIHYQNGYVRGFSTLTEAGKTNAYAFEMDFEKKEVAVGGRVVSIGDKAYAYDETTNKYMSLEDALEKYKEFSIMVDKTVDTGGIVRMVIVK